MDIATLDKQARKNAFTTRHRDDGADVRSIQIGLRGPAVTALLDPTVVVRIEDVTERFRECGHQLALGGE